MWPGDDDFQALMPAPADFGVAKCGHRVAEAIARALAANGDDVADPLSLARRPFGERDHLLPGHDLHPVWLVGDAVLGEHVDEGALHLVNSVMGGAYS